MKYKISVLAIIFFSLSSFNVYSATLVTDSNDVLTGINGVEIPGYGYYDVSFNKAFNTVTAGLGKDLAIAATQSLFSLFSTGILADSIYDNSPNMVRGCEFETWCVFWTKEYHEAGSSRSSFWMFENKDAANDIRDGIAGHIGITDAPLYPGYTHAEWTASSIVATPIPAALFLFAPALMGTIGLRRKAKIFPVSNYSI